MTILATEGFELERTSTAFLRRYPGSTGVPTTFPDQDGRLGGKAYKAETNQVIHIDLPDVVSSNLIIGYGLYVATISSVVDYPITIIYGAGDIITAQMSLFTTSGEDGFRLRVERNSSGGLIEEYVTRHILSFGYWYYIEVDFRPITDSRGTWVKINDDTEITTIFDDATVLAGYERMEIDIQPSSYIAIDDLYVDDTNFHGSKMFIQGLSPISDVSNDWTPTGEITGFETIDDAADNYSVDDDTTYVSAGASNRTDLYRFAPILNSFGKPGAARYAVDAKSTAGSVPLTPIFDGVDRTQLTLGASYDQLAVTLQQTEIEDIIGLQDMETGFRAQ